MRIKNIFLNGSVLPTVLTVSVLILIGLVGLMALYEQQILLFTRTMRLRQSRADAESAFTLYATHPDFALSQHQNGARLYDSVAYSRVHITTRPWGLYELVEVTTADSLVHTARFFGSKSDDKNTLFYTDCRTPLTLAGKTTLQGTLQLPQSGIIYGRVGSGFYTGEELQHTSIRRSGETLPQAGMQARQQIEKLLSIRLEGVFTAISTPLVRSFIHDSTAFLNLNKAEIGNCRLTGNIVLYADELRIDSTCVMTHLLICARKVTVGHGARIAAQIFARDTVLVEARAILEQPSGIYSGRYAELEEHTQVNGFVIVRDTMPHRHPEAAYRQSCTARVRGLVWIDGTAQIQGIVSGRLLLRKSAHFTKQGYYENVLYDLTLLENPETAHPLWLSDSKVRKEVICVE